MKIYVLCSYGDGLNDPDVSTDYQELYEKMEKSYRMTLDHFSETEEEQENTYLSEYSARAVIHYHYLSHFLWVALFKNPVISNPRFPDESRHYQRMSFYQKNKCH